MDLNALGKITDLTEGGQQTALQKIKALRGAFQECDRYMEDYANAKVAIGKTVGMLAMVEEAVTDTYRALMELHRRAGDQEGSNNIH